MFSGLSSRHIVSFFAQVTRAIYNQAAHVPSHVRLEIGANWLNGLLKLRGIHGSSSAKLVALP
jgi:hypothetical protein